MTKGSEWRAQVGRSWADNYRLTDRAFAGLTERLLGRIGGCDGSHVLDIGCGAGELSLALARGNPGASVVGVDLSPDLIAVARERGGAHANLRFVEADAALWQPGEKPCDLLVSRHGVMFFDAPVAAFAHLADTASDGARLVFSCFRGPRLNPWAWEMARLLGLPTPGEGAEPGPFAFADTGHVATILRDAGWKNPQFEAVDFAFVTGMGSDPIADAMHFFGRIGPAAPALRAMTEPERDRARDTITQWLEEHRSGNLVAFPAAGWIVTATK